MRLDIRGQHIEVTPALHAHAVRRLQFALGRFGPRIARVAVRLTDLNGPRGGRDKQCRMVAEMPREGKVIVEDIELTCMPPLLRPQTGWGVRSRVRWRGSASTHGTCRGTSYAGGAGIPPTGTHPQRSGVKRRERERSVPY